MKIVEARIHRTSDPVASVRWGGSARVMVRFDETHDFEQLFAYFHDEIDFSEAEFIGLDRQEALTLLRKRDVAYLRS